MSKSKNSQLTVDIESLCPRENIEETKHVKKHKSKNKTSVRDIASIFEQKAKHNTPIQKSARKNTMDNFAINSSHKLIQDSSIKKNKTENSFFEEKLSSVHDISASINKEIVTKSEKKSILIKKRSQSLNPSSLNKINHPEEKIKRKSAKDVKINLCPYRNHIQEIAKLYQDNDCNSYDEHKSEEIFTQQFTEFLNCKQSNKMDLSVISEKEDNNTSISFMEKENKIRNFIISAIQEIKNISTEKSHKKSITENGNKDLIKNTFFMSRKNNHNESIKIDTEETLTRELEVFMEPHHINNAFLKTTHEDHDTYSGPKCYQESTLFQNCEKIKENTEVCIIVDNENDEKVDSLLKNSQSDSVKIIEEEMNHIKISEEVQPEIKIIEENFENVLSASNCNKEGMITNGMKDLENSIELQVQTVCEDHTNNKGIIHDSINIQNHSLYKMISEEQNNISREITSKILDEKSINSSSDNDKICVYVNTNRPHYQCLSFPCTKNPEKYLLITFLAMYKFPLFFNLIKQLEIKIEFC